MEGLLARYGDGGKYEELFLSALKQYGMLCIGIYRHVVSESSPEVDFVKFFLQDP